jgi:biopolymer transport protein ExbD
MATLSGRGVGLALFILGTGILGATEYWDKTRTFVAYDAPLSLRHGHILTPAFEINLPDYYAIEILGTPFFGGPGLSCKTSSAFQYEWTLWKDGKIFQQSGSSAGNRAEIRRGVWFYAEKGRYQLDIDFLSDPSCANTENTRLVVEIDPDTARNFAASREPLELFSVIPIVLGLIVFFQSKKYPFVTPNILPSFPPTARTPEFTRATSIVASGSDSRSARTSLRGWSPLQTLRARRWSALGAGRTSPRTCVQFPLVARDAAKSVPTVSMVYVIFLWAFVPSWLAVGSSMHYIPAGLTVRVLGPRTVVGSKLAGETLSVWIDARNQWYFNSKPTTPRELPGLLRESLARQSSQVVYVDADDNVDFNVVVRAIDVVRREHAQVILITTRDRGDAAGAVPTK